MDPTTKLAKPCVGNEIFLNGSKDNMIEDPVDFNEYENGRYYYREKGADDVPTQRFKVIDERHFTLHVVSIE